MPYLFLLFLAVPVVEIALFVQVGGVLGLLPTLLIVIGTAALGTWMLRQQGMKTLQSARNRLDAGQLPATEMVEGMVLLVGGVLLLTPGFMTDAFGFLCLLPASRTWIAKRLGARMLIVATGSTVSGAGVGKSERVREHGRSGADGQASEGPGTVIDGDYERLD